MALISFAMLAALTSTTLAAANLPPVADAGPDQIVPDPDGDGSALVTYDGSASTDPDGSITAWRWTAQSNGDTLLGTSPVLSVVQAVGSYVVELTVTDDQGAQSTDFLTVVVGDPPVPQPQGPFAILESDQAFSGIFSPPSMGGSVASAGDVNGDGFDDVIVGAPGYDAPGGQFDEGAVFVFLGSAGGIVGHGPLTAQAAIIGDEAGAKFGSSVDGAGDVNGDGFDDIIVGAPTASPSGLSVSGAAYLFYGGPSGIVANAPADADAVLESQQIEAHMGRDVAGAGDVNGDGFADVIVGAGLYGEPLGPGFPNQGSGRSGAAFVFLGSAAGIVGQDPSTAHAQLVPWAAGQPSQSQVRMGSAVDGAGDVNGDGFDDVIVGAFQWNNDRPWPGTGSADPPKEGAAFVFLGGPNGIGDRDPLSADGRIEGNLLEAGLGSSVAGAGDVNGDGFDDIIVGAVTYPAGDPLFLSQEGAFFVFLGGPAGITASSPADAQAAVEGSLLAEWLGRAVDSAGDADGDGFDDVIVGARIFPGSLAGEGIAYLFHGGPAGIVATSLADASLQITGGQAGADLGLAVGNAGDVDGNGLPELIVGVPGYTGDRNREGAAFVQPGIATPSVDSDGDGVPDTADNCIALPNGPLLPDAGGHSQLDADGDGFGNACDGDLDNDGFVNFADLALFRVAFGSADPVADMDGSGFVNFADLALFRTAFGAAPGPSGVAP